VIGVLKSSSQDRAPKAGRGYIEERITDRPPARPRFPGHVATWGKARRLQLFERMRARLAGMSILDVQAQDLVSAGRGFITELTDSRRLQTSAHEDSWAWLNAR
jgi:hypothetical protein